MTPYHLCLYVTHTRVSFVARSSGIYYVKHIKVLDKSYSVISIVVFCTFMPMR